MEGLESNQRQLQFDEAKIIGNAAVSSLKMDKKL